jgi:hypothetical protein
VLRLIILLMVLLSVANSVNMSVFERVGEFGTMMALGNLAEFEATLAQRNPELLNWFQKSRGADPPVEI